ncbi:hypothetical protein MTR67_039911, partial [Solanum verrucosum]
FKESILNKSIEAFSQGGDGVLRYQGRLCVPDVGLPRTRRQHDSIWVIVDRMTKSAHFIHVKSSFMAKDYAKLYSKEIQGLGTNVKLSTAFNHQTDSQAEHTIQTLEHMLRACVIDFKGNWDDYLPLIEFSFNNSYHTSIAMAPFEALYGRRCRSPVGWFEVGEVSLLGPKLVHMAIEKICLIRERLKTGQSRQKFYVDVRRRDLEFKVANFVYLKISPMKGVMRFGK